MKRSIVRKIRRTAIAALAVILFVSSELSAYGALVPQEGDIPVSQEEKEREVFAYPEPNIYEGEGEPSAKEEYQPEASKEEVPLLAPDLTEEVLPYAEKWEEPIETGMYYKTYQNPDGSFRTVYTAAPNLYEDEEGKECPIDNTLVLEETSASRSAVSAAAELPDEGTAKEQEPSDARAFEGVYVNKANSMRVELPAVMLPEEGRGITIEEGGIRLTMLPEEGDYSHAIAEENALRYNQVFDNIDIQYTVQETGVKEDVILLAPT